MNTAASFQQTYCSQCGRPQGPGASGFSHCADHAGDLRDHFDQGQLDELIDAAQEAAAVRADLHINKLKNTGELRRRDDERAFKDQLQWEAVQ